MPRSLDAERELADAREAIACRAYARAADHVWTGAAAAASIGDEDALASLLALIDALSAHEDVAQLRLYVTEALEEARRGTRPPSMFERMMRGDQRPR